MGRPPKGRTVSVTRKFRLDPDLLQEAEQAVASGLAPTMTAIVESGMRLWLARWGSTIRPVPPVDR
jgi:hypothetical protein